MHADDATCTSNKVPDLGLPASFPWSKPSLDWQFMPGKDIKDCGHDSLKKRALAQ